MMLASTLAVACDEHEGGDEPRGGVVAADPAPLVEDALYDLGQALFFDKILSGNQDVACASCHHPALATDDDRSVSRGVGAAGSARQGGHLTPRNAPALFNLHLFPAMFWDGRIEHGRQGRLITPAGDALTAQMAATLTHGVVAAQAMFPVVDRGEMRGETGSNELADRADDDYQAVWKGLMMRLGAIPEYVDMFELAYPGVAFDQMTFAHAANAIAAYELRAFEAIDSPYQRFLLGDDGALTTRQRRGMDIFLRECAGCHVDAALSDFRHHNTGLAQIGPGAGQGPQGNDDFGREVITGDPRDRYAFRTAPLLNVTLTAPYGHAGQFDDLRAFVAHYHNVDEKLHTYRVEDHASDPAVHQTLVLNATAILAGVDSNVRDIQRFAVDDVVAFLEATTADSARDLRHTVPASVPSGLPIE